MRFKDKRKLLCVLLAVFSAIVLVTVVTRAAITNITDDEAYTYLQYVRHIDIFRWETVRQLFRESLANNHPLNTLLINLCERLFRAPYSEFVIRLPALLFFLLYLCLVYRAFRNGTVSFACAMLLAGNCYLNEFYGLARGYCMANTFVLIACLYYIAWEASGYCDGHRLTGCALALLAGVLSNTIVLMIVPAFGLLWLLRLYTHGQLKEYLKRRWWFVVFFLAVSLLCVRYHLNVSAAGKPLYVGSGSFLRMTVLSFIRMFVQNKAVVIALCVTVAALFVFCVLRLKKELLTEDFFLLAVIFAATNILLEAVLHKGYMTGRVLLPFYAFAVLCAERLLQRALGAKDCNEKTALYLRRILTVTISAACVCLFLVRFDVRKTREWENEYGRRELVLSQLMENGGAIPPVREPFNYTNVFYLEKFSGTRWEP